jgi:hypothetical protein
MYSAKTLAINPSFSGISHIFLVFILVILVTFKVNAQQKAGYSPKAKSNSLWIGASVGPSLLIEKAPDSLIIEIQDYFNKLRSGWNYGFESEYFFNHYIGAGVKYSRFNTKQEVDSIVVEFFSKIYYIDLSSNMSIHTLSPMIYGKLPLLRNKLSVIGGIGPAWLLYRNIGKAVGDSAMFKGSSPGLSTTLNVAYEVLPNLSIGFQASYIRAFLKEFTQDDGNTQQVIKLDEENYQNISRMDYSFGIFYTFRRK